MADEILAHISAPVTRHNDDLYRSLAAAYLAFEPYQFHSNNESTPQKQSDHPALPDQASPVASTREILPDIRGNTSILSTSKESYGSFPSYLSSGDYMPDGENGLPLNRKGLSPQDSHPTSSRLARFEHIHQRWKSSATPRLSSDRLDGQDRPLPSSDDSNTAFIEDTQLEAQALQSQIQDDSFGTFEDLLDGDVGEVGDAGDEEEKEHTSEVQSSLRANLRGNACGKTLSSFKQSEFSTDFGTSPAQQLTMTEESDPAILTVPDSGLEASGNRADEQPESSVGFDFSKLPTEIFPPAPTISIDQHSELPSQVTQYLATLKTQNPSRFRPKENLRQLENDERGYWLVETSDWPDEMQLKFWETLCDHIISGQLGWGTTLHRDLASPSSLGKVRLYCWGEVVEHMWLTLWLSSRGMVATSKTQWLDADGVVLLDGPK